MSFEAGIVGIVRAAHVMPGRPLPEGDIHSHEYRLEVVVERPELDEAGMAVDLDTLRNALQQTIIEVDGVDLGEHLQLEEVTVERFARWVHARIADAIGSIPDATIRVRVWEAPDAFGGYAAPVR
jgi:6-pyruvoyltetrahydropterin/6-carboxytetrahydropterin synthase